MEMQRTPLAAPIVKSWELLPHDQVAVETLAAALNCSPIVAQLLLNRGLATPDAARRFLDAPLNGLHQPDLLPGVIQAVDRIMAAIAAGRKICVYGDYDVDGVSGTAILLQVLRLLRAQVDLYLPHRLTEGYGLNCEALREIARNGAAMVVTVDCGIASIDEAEEARNLGLELIVTDHHEFKDRLPNAAVLVHPRLPGTHYPFGKLSGSAVAFKLAWALALRESGGPKVTPRFRDFLLDSVALASLGIVADVVPLHDENRILVRHGLERMRKAPQPGMQALCESAGLQAGAELRASDIGYKIAPRLNAAGRLGSARRVVELLTTTRPEQAIDLARSLEEENIRRQGLEREMVSQARALIDQANLANDPALVLAHSNWHPGIIGIVAGRMADLFARPALMIALPSAVRSPRPSEQVYSELALGSGRSIAGFALNEALHACGDLLVGYGGHPMAAGFRMLPGRISAFRDRLCEYTARHFSGGLPKPVLILDAETPLSTLTFGLLTELDRLEPYGAENRRPLFLAGPVEVQGEPRRVGQGERHLSFRVKQHGVILKAIAFNMGDRAAELMSAQGQCFLVFTPKRNDWMGRSSIDLEVADFQAGPQPRLAPSGTNTQ
jgi:single-stranded-DNA-specific exonuclease